MRQQERRDEKFVAIGEDMHAVKEVPYQEIMRACLLVPADGGDSPIRRRNKPNQNAADHFQHAVDSFERDSDLKRPVQK